MRLIGRTGNPEQSRRSPPRYRPMSIRKALRFGLLTIALLAPLPAGGHRRGHPGRGVHRLLAWLHRPEAGRHARAHAGRLYRPRHVPYGGFRRHGRAPGQRQPGQRRLQGRPGAALAVRGHRPPAGRRPRHQDGLDGGQPHRPGADAACRAGAHGGAGGRYRPYDRHAQRGGRPDTPGRRDRPLRRHAEDLRRPAPGPAKRP